MSQSEQIQELGCSTPSDSVLCKQCRRNAPHEEFEEYKLETKIMQADTCSGYVHKKQGSLF